MEIVVRVSHLAVGDQEGTVVKTPRPSIECTLEGIVDDRHGGFVKKAGGQDFGMVRGTPVRNWRQWSAVSTEELSRISAALELESLDPTWLGANFCFSGHQDLTTVLKGSMIWFPSGLVLAVEGENAPCLGPGREIARRFPHIPAAQFPKAAMHLRGIVGVVYAAGRANVGDEAVIRVYEPYEAIPRAPQGRPR